MDHRKKEDLRVIRTKKAIRAAFAELLSEKDPVDVTVTEIAACAQINRKTFYNIRDRERSDRGFQRSDAGRRSGRDPPDP